MMTISSAIGLLREATTRSGEPIVWGSVSSVDLDRISSSIPLSDELREWYSRACPMQFEIPWTIEWLLLCPPAELVEYQTGYKWQDDKHSERDPRWNDSWLVIGDCSGDPIIADTGRSHTPILHAVHGTGIWNPKEITPSLANFLGFLARWLDVAVVEFGGRIRDQDGIVRVDFLGVLENHLRQFLGESHANALLSIIQE